MCLINDSTINQELNEWWITGKAERLPPGAQQATRSSRCATVKMLGQRTSAKVGSTTHKWPCWSLVKMRRRVMLSSIADTSTQWSSRRRSKCCGQGGRRYIRILYRAPFSSYLHVSSGPYQASRRNVQLALNGTLCSRTITPPPFGLARDTSRADGKPPCQLPNILHFRPPP
jgi:hypothetical protein